MDTSIPYGAWPILLTPFTLDGSIDWPALDELLDFYIEHKVPGFLALGQASEVLTLTVPERFAIGERIAKRCKGKLRTVAVSNYGATLDEQAESMAKMVALGIDVAVVGASLLPSPNNLGDQLLALADKTGPSCPLGVYELPEPEHRLLTTEDVRKIAGSGRYVFMKDTCRQTETFTAKVAAAKDTPLKIFQANMQILPPSLKAGCHGFCGHMAVVAPELVEQACNMSLSEETRMCAYEKLMAFQNWMRAQGFPASAKYILSRCGLHMTPRCRVTAPELFTPDNAHAIDELLQEQDWFAVV